MTDNEPTLIGLPQELADVLIAIGAARRKVSSQRSAATDAILLSVSTAGAVVSLLQGPTAIRDLARFLQTYVGRHRTPLPVAAVGSREQRTFTVTTDTNAEQLEQYLDQILGQNLEADVVVKVRDASTQSVPAGWYRAQGDPEGTVRYWDGSLWHGGPVPEPS